MRTRAFVLGLTLLAAAVPGSGRAQQGSPRIGVGDLDLETYRSLVSAERRAVMAANIGLDVGRRARFFELYDAFDKDRAPLDAERFALLQRYAASYVSLSDPQAMALIRAMASLQTREIELRSRHAGQIEKALGGKVGARFYQVDDVVTTAARLSSLQGIPLVGSAAAAPPQGP